MLAGKPVIIHIIQNIYVMNKYWGLVVEQRGSLLQCATRLQQLFGLVADVHHRGIVLPGHMVNNLLGKMMDIDDKTAIALRLQLTNVMV